jgi:tripartite-type tricarboxylate transporter receptor subunit TctC
MHLVQRYARFLMPHTLVRAAAVTATALAATLLSVAPVNAQNIPGSAVSLMVPYPAGGPSDVIARVFNTPLGRELGIPVMVENLGGVSGALGAQKVLSAPADGHFLYQGSPNEVILSPLANAAVKFDAEDFQLVQLIAYAPLVVVVRKELAASNMDELITLARNTPKDKPLNYGSVGIGSLYHVLAEHLGQVIKAQMTHVPYKGVAPLLQDLAGGNLDYAILPQFGAIDGMVAAGRVKVLGQLGATRAETLKNLPTVTEGKLLKDFSFTIWTGYMVKKGTPPDATQKLQKAVQAVLTDPKVRESLSAQYQIVAKPMPLDESAKFFAQEAANYRKLAKAVGIERQ